MDQDDNYYDVKDHHCDKPTSRMMATVMSTMTTVMTSSTMATAISATSSMTAMSTPVTTGGSSDNSSDSLVFGTQLGNWDWDQLLFSSFGGNRTKTAQDRSMGSCNWDHL
ncbi:hypothetical protein EDB84DRAFT_1447352 [Lactarius hengduanensis]|nr:hypothetical protein EDB84DRAFT_1447352 [Lactarius hengduanensis]